MFRIDGMSRTPVYEQIIEQVEKLVSLGIMKAGDQLPSVRSLSIELSVNPNTIQKAYGELDAKGITASVPGKGSFVIPGAREKLLLMARGRLLEIQSLAAELMGAGVTADEIIDAVNQVASKTEEDK